MQRPHRRPSPTFIPNPPAGESLGPGALPAPHHLSRHAEQPQRRRGALDRTHRQARQLGQPGVSRPAVASGAVIGERGARLSHGHKGFQADGIIRHRGPDMGVVAQRICRRHGVMRPTLGPATPTGNGGPVSVDVQDDAREAVDAVRPGAPDPDRRGVGRPAAPAGSAAAAIGVDEGGRGSTGRGN